MKVISEQKLKIEHVVPTNQNEVSPFENSNDSISEEPLLIKTEQTPTLRGLNDGEGSDSLTMQSPDSSINLLKNDTPLRLHKGTEDNEEVIKLQQITKEEEHLEMNFDDMPNKPILEELINKNQEDTKDNDESNLLQFPEA